MQPLGKRERLRQGEAVELKPGVFGRLNKENKTLELDSGKVLPVSAEDQRDLFSENPADIDVARRTEKLESQVKKAPFGEFLHQFGSQGVLNAPKDWIDYFTQSGEEYLRQKEAEGRVSSRISNESPIMSGAATVASFAPDLALTSGMSAAKAAPLLTTLGSGSRIVSEPEEVLKEGAIAFGGGKLLDMGTNALNRIAARRAEARALPGKQESVRNLNIKGMEDVRNFNSEQQQKFNALTQNIKETNQKKLADYQNALETRKNDMIQAENAWKQSKFSSNQQKKVIYDNYKIAKKQYDEALKNLPALQKQAQSEYSRNVLKNVEGIEKAFPAGSKITNIEIDVPGFFDNVVGKTGQVATREEAQAKRILTSLFPASEELTAAELASKYKAIEEAILQSPKPVQNILNDFKMHLGDRIPSMVSNNLAFKRIVPTLEKTILRDIESALKKLPPQSGFASPEIISSRMQENLKKYISELKPSGFLEKLQTGELKQELLDKMLNPFEVANFSKGTSKKAAPVFSSEIEPPQSFKDLHNRVMDLVRGKIDDAIAKSEIKTLGMDYDVSKKLGAKVRKTYGLSEPVAKPSPPESPLQTISNFPQQNLPPPAIPDMPVRPTMTPEPMAPVQKSFSPMPEPQMSPAMGFADKAGDFLEQNLLGGKTALNNPLTKLAGLKYLLGKSAAPVEAAYVGLKGLTSPNVAGEAVRMTFKQGGIKAIEMWAAKYPSYKNGVIQSPQERRSLTKEIEDSHEIPIEQKAILQSKVNRGIPLGAPLH